MQRSCLLPSLVVAWLAASPVALADGFAIHLEARAGQATRKAKGQDADPRARPKPRGVLEVKAGQSVTVKWTVTRTAKKEAVKDVVVHFFAVKEDKVGQAAVPKLDKDVTAESALTMDFGPGDKSDAETTLQIDTPGNYLLRVETIGADGADGREHFATLDLVVK